MCNVRIFYYVCMQNKNAKSLYLRKVLGSTIKTLRENQKISGNKLANEYEIGNGNLSRIENAITDCKFITLWKISEALNMKFSELALRIEENLEENFKLMDE